ILVVLQDKVKELNQSRSADERLSRWLNPTIDVLYAFSATLGEGVGLVFSPAKVISAGVGVFLSAAKDVEASQDALIDLFERIENFFKRLESYTSVRPTDAMTDIIIKIMIEALNIFVIATKEMRQSRAKRYLKKLIGKKEIEDALKRLDKLTQEARMAAAEILKLSHIVDDKVTTVAGLASIAYFYFDFRDLDKQNRRNLLSSLLVQLSTQSGPRCDILHRLYLEHEKGGIRKWLLRRSQKWPTECKTIHRSNPVTTALTFTRFRWVFCQLETLRQCLPQCVRRTINELPESLDGTYERVMMDIKKANQVHAYSMLQCLTVAVRPLSVAELAELLAFDFDVAKGGIPELNLDWRWEDHEQAVLSTCSSLITVVPGRGSRPPVVQFSHFSVKEFLMSDRLATSSGDISQYHIFLEDSHTVLAQACLGVLLRGPDVKNGADFAPLARYAAEQWVTHARVENVASRIRDGMEQLFNPDHPYFEAWVQLHDADADADADDNYDPDMADLKPGEDRCIMPRCVDSTS
ncbi:hypothetical protein EDB89DRAFT_1857819, partial [Lactarius sanguifluus]